MSAVIINIDDLEFVWRSASDGFSAGVDFKTWLAANVIQLRADLQAAQIECDRIDGIRMRLYAQVADQARKLEQARQLIGKLNQRVYLKRDLQVEVNHWLAANAPQPQEQDDLPFGEM